MSFAGCFLPLSVARGRTGMRRQIVEKRRFGRQCDGGFGATRTGAVCPLPAIGQSFAAEELSLATFPGVAHPRGVRIKAKCRKCSRYPFALIKISPPEARRAQARHESPFCRAPLARGPAQRLVARAGAPQRGGSHPLQAGNYGQVITCRRSPAPGRCIRAGAWWWPAAAVAAVVVVHPADAAGCRWRAGRNPAAAGCARGPRHGGRGR